MFEIIVDTLEEMKNWEMYIFTLTLPFETKGSMYVRENNCTYFYRTEKIKNGFTLITDDFN